MSTLTALQMKGLVDQWKNAGAALQKVHDEELAAWVYDWKEVDDLLDIGERFGGATNSDGLVEMQCWFKKFAIEPTKT
ncbi:MAG: hypothetical protein WC889_10600 [Myxococcota bacterium]